MNRGTKCRVGSYLVICYLGQFCNQQIQHSLDAAFLTPNGLKNFFKSLRGYHVASFVESVNLNKQTKVLMPTHRHKTLIQKVRTIGAKMQE